MKNDTISKYGIVKEYVDEVKRKIISLKKKMHSEDDNFNTEAFHEKEIILSNFSKDTETRVKNIIEILKCFPEGIWRKMKFPGLDNYIHLMERNKGGKLKCSFYDEENDEFGYEYTTGYDDGYPTSSSMTFPSELLWISDSELESKLDEMVLSAINESIAHTTSLYLMEKNILNEIKNIIKMKNTETKIANLFPFVIKEVNDERCITPSGKHVSYNIVDKNGLGHASFGVEYDVAFWFCKAANEYAKKLLSKK